MNGMSPLELVRGHLFIMSQKLDSVDEAIYQRDWLRIEHDFRLLCQAHETMLRELSSAINNSDEGDA